VRNLLQAMTEVHVDGVIAESAGVLRRRYRTDVADALIAATAMQLGVPLLTRNRRHYQGVRGLKLQAP